jgi:cation:H+ antiporter
MILLLYAAVIAAATVVVWKGSGLLERNAARLATHYRLPPLVQGAVITAVGSSFPELSSTVIATLVHGEFALGVAGIVGSAVFNILVIPGLAGLISGRMASDRLLVYKDAQFYITSVAVLLLAFSFALIYHPVPGEPWSGEMTRGVALVPLGLYVLYLFLQQQDTAEHHADLREQAAGVPNAGVPNAGVSDAGVSDAGVSDEAADVPVGRAWALLALSLGLTVVGVEGLVWASIGLGDFFGTPSFLWGLTVIAAGTSLPDALVSIRAAKAGDSVVSFANVLGSNIFDLLVAIPAGVLVAGAATIDFAAAMPLMGFLTLATIVLFAMLRTGLQLRRTEAAILLGLYALFLLWIALETAGVLNWTQGAAV